MNNVPVWALSKNDSINPFNDIYCNAVLDQIVTIDADTKEVITDCSIADARVLYSFQNQPIAIVYSLDPEGYAILDFKNCIVLEYSTTVATPFPLDEDVKYYYNGLASYYELTENGYRDLTSGKIIPLMMNGSFFIAVDGDLFKALLVLQQA